MEVNMEKEEMVDSRPEEMKAHFSKLNKTTSKMSDQQIEGIVNYILSWEGLSLYQINDMNRTIETYGMGFIKSCSISV